MATTEAVDGPQIADAPPIADATRRRRPRFGKILTGSVLPRVVLIAGRHPVHHPVLLDVRQRAEVQSGAHDVPARAGPRRLGVAELHRRGQLHPVRAVRAELVHHHGRHHDRVGPLEHRRGLRVLAHPVARPEHDVLRLHRDAVPAVPGHPRRAVRHLQPAALVRDPGGEVVGRHLPAPDRARLLRQPVLHLPDETVHARDPEGAVGCGQGGRRVRDPDVLEGHPAADQAGHRGGRDLRRGRRLERVPAAACSISRTAPSTRWRWVLPSTPASTTSPTTC